jgi:ABC-2 type transport system ATP-binding protein
MIKVKNLTKIYKTPERQNNFFKDLFLRKYKEKIALDKVSFEIEEGELVGFIGPNGAGKTTTLKILSGILYPTSGEVQVFGYFPFDKKKEFLRQIAFIMGTRNQTIWELPAIDSFLLTKEIYQINDFDFKKNLSEMIDLFNVSHLINQPIKTLSLGERMKMELINNLIHKPRLVFFDEPTIGLDIFSQEVIRDFIKKFQQKYGSTIILTSHYLEDVKKLTKRLIIINQGKIIYDGAIDKIYKIYSKEKFITVILEKEVDMKTLKNIGEVYQYQYPKVIFKIPKEKIAEKINLINKLPYSDLTVEEEKIEEIIKKIISNQ